MRKLHDTLSRLAALRPMNSAEANRRTNGRLERLARFGTNAGDLAGWTYVPTDIAANAPLVVVLHGCTQTASAYDSSSGWSKLAEKHGFALLYPEQQRSNNPNLCFNWFSAEDASRESGEAQSIRQMVAVTESRHGIDPNRVFVTGLSAGGAMAAVMLATYPDVFAGGAVIAGLPFGIANSVPEAFDRMRGQGSPDHDALPGLVRAASNHSGPWPILSVWHGSADRTVDPSNATALVEQWRSLHGTSKAPSRTDIIHGYPHRVWCDGSGREVVEEYSISGFPHGTPLDTRTTEYAENAGPYMLEAGISSTRLIAAFWGIISDRHESVSTHADRQKQPPPFANSSLTQAALHPVSAPPVGVAKTIEDALRSAGLMK